MPHLDHTYIISQIFWCIIFFLFIYFTVSKGFWIKFRNIISDRKILISSYLDKASKLELRINDLEIELEKMKKNASQEISDIKKEAMKAMEEVRNKRIYDLKCKFEEKEKQHQEDLENLKLQILKGIESSSETIDKNVNLYLLKDDK